MLKMCCKACTLTAYCFNGALRLWMVFVCLPVAVRSFGMSVPTFNPLNGDGTVSQYLITCGGEKCNHGKCVMLNGQPSCECKLGYTGDACSESVNAALSVPLTLGVLGVIAGFIILIFGLAFARQMQKAKQRKKTADEVLRTNGMHL